MSIISVFFGIIIRIHPRDHNPPHIHAFYGDYEGLYNIKTGEKIQGNIPFKQNKIIRKWTGQNRKDLLRNWKLAYNEKQTFKIRGAK